MTHRKKHIEGYNYLFIMIVFLAMLGALVGCMSDRTALQRVLTKKPLFDTTGQIYMQLYPCDNKVIASKADTIIKHDSSISYEPYYIDCPNLNSHDTVPKKIKVLIPVKTYVNNTRIIDSITRIDNQQLSLCKSQIQDKDKQIAILNQSVTDSRLQAAVNEKDASKWELYFWLLIAAIVIALVLYIVKPRL